MTRHATQRAVERHGLILSAADGAAIEGWVAADDPRAVRLGATYDGLVYATRIARRWLPVIIKGGWVVTVLPASALDGHRARLGRHERLHGLQDAEAAGSRWRGVAS